MLQALSECLRASDRRILFVLGKGGVGKTTTAAAVALQHADSGEATHLLSTDPAHSLGDVFDLSLSGIPRPSPCTPALTLEELDARAHARAWVRRVAGPIAQLVERGTYLDAADADTLTGLSLPGVDELMAALRLVELAAEPVQRIVVDTAPTGHALRLLDAGALVSGWVAALDAMADKARAVGSALVGARVPVPGDELVAELRRDVERFRTEVLARAGFLVVTRPGVVAAAETARLLDALARRRLALEAVLVTGGERAEAGAPAGVPVLAVPLTAPPRGCAALRAWGAPASASAAAPRVAPAPPAPALETAEPRSRPAPSAAPARAPESPAAPPPAWLAAAPPLVLFAGKGGVGKSTCAAACALALGRERRVVLLSTDPAGSLGEVLGTTVGEEGVRVGGVLARQVDAPAELARVQRRYREEVASAFGALGLDGAAALDRAVVEALWGLAPPGVDELLATVRMLAELEAGATLVIDPAPTGHFLRLLEMPEIALEWTHALMRLILKYRLARELDAVARELLQFARDLKDLLARLGDAARAAAFVVTLDEPVVAAETRRLLQALARARLHVAGVVVNRADAGLSRGDARGAPAGEVPGPPLFFAPLLPSPPIGPEALAAFLRRWEAPS